MELENPLIWQVSFTDQDISQLIEARFAARQAGGGAGLSPPHRAAAGANAMRIQNMTSAIQHQHDVARARAMPKPVEQEKKALVPRMDLAEDPMCCICHQDMQKDQKLTYCKTGCGHNLHVDCVLVWAKHKHDAKQDITCPLCRSEWGPGTIRRLKQDAGMEEHIEQERKEERKQPQPRRPGSSNFQRTFKCSICNHRILSDPRFHCTICPRMQLCQECYSLQTHSQHQFIVLMRPGDSDWKPAPPRGAFADQQAMQEQTAAMNEYHRILDQLTNRELTAAQNARLNQLERFIRTNNRREPGRSNQIPRVSLADYLANVYELAAESREINIPNAHRGEQCVFCEIPAHGSLDVQFKPIKLRCGHFIHKCCLSSLFERNVPHCPVDRKPILEGFAAVVKQRRAPPPRPQQAQRRAPPTNYNQALLTQSGGGHPARTSYANGPGSRRGSFARTNSHDGPFNLRQQPRAQQNRGGGRAATRGGRRGGGAGITFGSQRGGLASNMGGGRHFSDNPLVDELVREVIAQQNFQEEMLNFSGLSEDTAGSQERVAPLTHIVGTVQSPPVRQSNLDESIWSDFYFHDNTVVPGSAAAAAAAAQTNFVNQRTSQQQQQQNPVRRATVNQRAAAQQPPRPPRRTQSTRVTQPRRTEQRAALQQQLAQQLTARQPQINQPRRVERPQRNSSIPSTAAVAAAGVAVAHAQGSLASAERRLAEAENLVSENAGRIRELTAALHQSNREYEQFMANSRFGALRVGGGQRQA